MAVSSDVARVVHTANGSATFFSYAPIDGATSANLKVYLFNPTTGVLTTQTLGTDYTFGGGGVTFSTAPPNGRRVILFRVVDLLQPDIYKTNAPFPAVVTEKRFDEVVKGLQQINDVVQNRSIILPLSDAGFSSNVLPAVENRKGRVLYFNATTGDPEAKSLIDVGTVTTFPAWADSFLFQSTAAAGLADIGAVAKAGDTMTGPLTLSGAPTATLHAATKGYVDTEVGTRVAKAGDTMTGLLTLSGAPTAANHATTKQYVDNIAWSESGNVTAGGSSVSFTGLPAGVKEIIINFHNISTSGTQPLLIRTGTSLSGFVASGYLSASMSASGSSVSCAGSANGFLLNVNTASATIGGFVHLVRFSASSSNIWLASGVLTYASGSLSTTSGSISMPDGPLDRVSIICTGSDTYDDGIFSIKWRE